MKCPFCGEQESKVVDSRHSEDGLSIRRRIRGHAWEARMLRDLHPEGKEQKCL